MDQSLTGRFIARKRKEKNLTQEQLAERIGVSNKTVSKWETGKSMPDYAVMKRLCKELQITVAELMDGEEKEEELHVCGEEQIMDLLRRVQELEQQRTMLYGIMLIVMGITLQAVAHTVGGSDMMDFLSGVLLGVSVGEMLVGAYVIGCRVILKQ